MMRPKLSEDPREWRKFSAAAVLALALGAYLLQRRGGLPARPTLIFLVTSVALVLVLFRPVWFRTFYRIGATAGFYCGQAVARVILAICFVLLVVPLGLLLRCLRKDLLQLQRDPGKSSYWTEVRQNSDLNRQF